MTVDAFGYALEKLKSADPEEIAKNSGCQWNGNERILVIPYLNNFYRLSFSDFSFSGEPPLNTREKILILHYLAGSKNWSETGNLISFSELEAGNIYKPSIEARIYKVLIDRFGASGEEFLKKAILLGAEETKSCKFSVRIQIFPKICIYINFYPADEELSASCQILFDSGIRKVMVTEDIVVMCEEIAEKLIS